MKFIGELFKVKMLSLDIIHTFVLESLSGDQRELSMECLCTLISTIGEKLDTENTKVSACMYVRKRTQKGPIYFYIIVFLPL